MLNKNIVRIICMVIVGILVISLAATGIIALFG